MANQPDNHGARPGELQELAEELSQRARGRRHPVMRMRLWNFTVAGSYAVKRLFDIAGALAGVILLSPLLALLALAVRLTSKGPAIYTQTRVGRFGRHFKFYKFRTMYIDADRRKQALLSSNESRDGVIFKMRHDPRVTPLGRLLRRSSLDELPQLLNVLLGDMSLVGPRPPLPSEVARYSLEDRKRLNAIPGLTCLWQVGGRSDIPFSQQVQLDKAYIHSRSFRGDLAILLRTIPAILTGRGAY